jgi:hypothetical protein
MTLLAPLAKHALAHDVDERMLRSCFVGRRAPVTNEIVRSANLFLNGFRAEAQERQGKASDGLPHTHRPNARRKKKS